MIIMVRLDGSAVASLSLKYRTIVPNVYVKAFVVVGYCHLAQQPNLIASFVVHLLALLAGWFLFVNFVIHCLSSLFRSCSNFTRNSNQYTLSWSLRVFSSSVIVAPEPPVLKLSQKVVAKSCHDIGVGDG
jgi:hypothetical protein